MPDDALDHGLAEDVLLIADVGLKHVPRDCVLQNAGLRVLERKVTAFCAGEGDDRIDDVAQHTIQVEHGIDHLRGAGQLTELLQFGMVFSERRSEGVRQVLAEVLQVVERLGGKLHATLGKQIPLCAQHIRHVVYKASQPMKHVCRAKYARRRRFAAVHRRAHPSACSHDPAHVHCLAPPFDLKLLAPDDPHFVAKRFQVGLAMAHALGAQDDLAGLRVFEQPVRQIDCITQGRELAPPFAADIAERRLAGVNSHPVI